MFRQEDGEFLRVNTYFGRWEISRDLHSFCIEDSAAFCSVASYTECPADQLEVTSTIGQELIWASKKWTGFVLYLKCSQHQKYIK